MDANEKCVPFTAILSTRDYIDFRGMVGLGGDGELVGGGVAKEFEAIAETMRGMLYSRGGFDLGNVVSMTAYIKNSRDLAALKKIYKEYFPNHRRRLKIIVAKQLSVEGANLEIDAVAYVRPDREVYSP